MPRNAFRRQQRFTEIDKTEGSPSRLPQLSRDATLPDMSMVQDESQGHGEGFVGGILSAGDPGGIAFSNSTPGTPGSNPKATSSAAIVAGAPTTPAPSTGNPAQTLNTRGVGGVRGPDNTPKQTVNLVDDQSVARYDSSAGNVVGNVLSKALAFVGGGAIGSAFGGAASGATGAVAEGVTEAAVTKGVGEGLASTVSNSALELAGSDVFSLANTPLESALNAAPSIEIPDVGLTSSDFTPGYKFRQFGRELPDRVGSHLLDNLGISQETRDLFDTNPGKALGRGTAEVGVEQLSERVGSTRARRPVPPGVNLNMNFPRVTARRQSEQEGEPRRRFSGRGGTRFSRS